MAMPQRIAAETWDLGQLECVNPYSAVQVSGAALALFRAECKQPLSGVGITGQRFQPMVNYRIFWILFYRTCGKKASINKKSARNPPRATPLIAVF